MDFIGTSTMGHAKEACYRCEVNRDLVDLDCIIVGEGTLALCKRCIQLAAEACGLLSKDKAK